MGTKNTRNKYSIGYKAPEIKIQTPEVEYKEGKMNVFFLLKVWISICREFPGSPVVRTLHFHCRGHGSNPWSPTCHVVQPKILKNEVLDVRIITEMKSLLESFNSRFEQAIESVNLKTDNWSYPVWGAGRKKVEEKWTEPNRLVGYHQGNQHTYGRPRKKGERERGRKNIWIVAKTS